METHVDSSNVANVCKRVCQSWHWATNEDCCDKGIRIMVGWDPSLVDVMVLAHSEQAYKEAVKDESLFLKQKSKVEWLSLGDSNSKYFHNVIKAKNHRSRIFSIRDGGGNLREGVSVPQVLVDHYSNFFGHVGSNLLQPAPDLFSNVLSVEKASNMVRQVTDDEIKLAMFSIAGNKSPGPDGYTSVFFKKSWDIVGNDICHAVRDFFDNGELLQQLNHTVISLIPKELMHNYHRNHGPPRCAFKVDIQKAYDTVDWNFLEHTLMGFRFDSKMIKWIMACVTSTSFSLAINGNLHGYFRGKQGLRQGDPMSPYLFTLVMEVLTLILQHKVSFSADFKFHHKCEKQRIINLCFADDLFLFARGDHKSASVILQAINTFSSMSRLVPSMSKSIVFFGNVSDATKDRIRGIIPFDEGVLPVRYLGVPLISTRLLYSDCKRLVENLESRITDWKTKSLSFAGRLQLILIISDLEDKMRRFLWAQRNNIKGKAKVKWSRVCKPKAEGGLGVRRVVDMNNALMVAHIWSLLTLRESLWVKWMHAYRIQDRSFWDIPLRGNVRWSWRKMLNLRPIIQQHVWVKLGDGSKTLVWFDKWDNVCPLSSFITPRMIRDAGFTRNMTVANMCDQGEWRWPTSWVQRFPALLNLPIVNLDEAVQDKVLWRTRSGDLMEYCAAIVWDDIRLIYDEVPWSGIVWFTQSIPRHSFFMWLLVNRKLKTQDVMSKWSASGNVNFNLLCCSLCTAGPDSHDHLFFECSYATQIWNGVKEKANMGQVRNSLDEILDHLVQRSNSKKALHVIGKLTVGAAAYFVWQERNQRLFSNKKRTPAQLIEVILSTVRLKLHTLRFRASIQVEEYEWSPLRCAQCKVFGHSDDTCPRQTRRAPKGPVTRQKQQDKNNNRKQVNQPVVDKDGFMDVDRKKMARKPGFPINKQKQKFEYRPLGPKPHGGTNTSATPSSVISKNPFDVLRKDGGQSGQTSEAHKDQLDSEDEEVREVYNETNDFMTSSSARVEASTSSTKLSNG
ncbi:uncharacterized protein LOC110913945 [Helianthus annuus]|uniref:uncharacterized protein LOC110913945 n=1 Tax=Helianthus annuus TaxID=4232 RepID=UPI000B8F4822|nr:uncharacterized protein LOC110913945 [Helianthus annuus]